MEYDLYGNCCHWALYPFDEWVYPEPQFDPTDYGDNNNDNNNDNKDDNKDESKDDDDKDEVAGDPEEPPKKVAKTAETE